MATETKPYKAISLFSGAMGLDIGLEKTGRFRVIACVEKERAFCDTIRANLKTGRLFPGLKLFEGDIVGLDPMEVLDSVGLKPGELDVTAAIAGNHQEWMSKSRQTYGGVRELDVIIGITYGTDRTSNNKENQILVKLLGNGFAEEDREKKPGVLIDEATRSTRVYRRIGKDFWAFVGNPTEPSSADFVFLEILLAFAKGLSKGIGEAALESRINLKMAALASALGKMMLPTSPLPDWIRKDFTESELFWFVTALTAFYDEGI